MVGNVGGDTFAARDFDYAAYASARPKYPPELFATINAAHDALKGSGRELALDMGCGPGTATANLIPHFKRVVGVDPSEGMVAAAKAHVKGVDFHVGGADAVPFIKDGSVDLIVSGTAAHWFPPDWWKEAERILKPRSTVAIFIYGAGTVGDKNPHSGILSALVDKFRADVANETGGGKIAREMYENLPLPPSGSTIRLVGRKWWNKDGRVDETEEGGHGRVVLTDRKQIKEMRVLAASMGPYHRWKVANPSVLGTAEDPVEKILGDIKKATGLGEDDYMDVGHPLVCLLFVKEPL